ncbi:hypothetical protein K438DRAFT_2019187, partial [Mycena galopus ATCC 62051]
RLRGPISSVSTTRRCTSQSRRYTRPYLILDLDTIIPENCFRDAVHEIHILRAGSRGV